MKKGKNGQQIAKENVESVKAWIAQRNERRDWHDYAYSNRINRSTLASELGFAKSVCTQNKTVKELLEEADALWFREAPVERAAQEAARERSEKISNQTNLNANKLARRVAELEVENRQLRQKLSAHEQYRVLIERGAPGFKL